MHTLSKLGVGAALLVTLSRAALPAGASVAGPPLGINGFSDPVGFTLNANSGGPDGQSAAAHGVPGLSGNTLHLTTMQGVQTGSTFYGSENTSAYANRPQYIGQFYASFIYHYNGSNHQSFGPGNGFSFILQNDPRGLQALGGTGVGNGQQGDGGTIMPSAAVEFGLFTGFGQNRGTQLALNGDPGTSGTFRDISPVKLVGANSIGDEYAPSDPVAVTLSYDGATLSETLTDTVTGSTYNTKYTTNLPQAVGSAYAYVGFTGGTGAAVADQTVTNFIFSNSVPAAPVNTGPKLTVTATASTADANGRRTIAVTVSNSGLAAADMLEITTVHLAGASPLPGSPSLLPTTKNLLPPNNSQTSYFYYAPSAGTTHLPLQVSGDYTDPKTGGTGTFSGGVRSLSLP